MVTESSENHWSKAEADERFLLTLSEHFPVDKFQVMRDFPSNSEVADYLVINRYTNLPVLIGLVEQGQRDSDGHKIEYVQHLLDIAKKINQSFNQNFNMELHIVKAIQKGPFLYLYGCKDNEKKNLALNYNPGKSIALPGQNYLAGISEEEQRRTLETDPYFANTTCVQTLMNGLSISEAVGNKKKIEKVRGEDKESGESDSDSDSDVDEVVVEVENENSEESDYEESDENDEEDSEDNEEEGEEEDGGENDDEDDENDE